MLSFSQPYCCYCYLSITPDVNLGGGSAVEDVGGGGGGERVWPGATPPPLTLIGNTLMGI